MKIKKGDTVKILQGKDTGKDGKVQQVFIKGGTVMVENLNIYKRHQKKRGEGGSAQGGIMSISRPLAVSKVILICPKCKKTTRIGQQISGKEKVRICKKCQAQI